jgi:hypothetical protein
VVGIIVMVHAVRRLECASATTSASAWHAPSLVVVACSLVKSPLTPFLQGWPKILFLVFQKPVGIRIIVVDMLGVIMLSPVIVVHWSSSVIVLWCFSLLLKLAEVEGLRLTEFGKILIKFCYYLQSFRDQMTMQGFGT